MSAAADHELLRAPSRLLLDAIRSAVEHRGSGVSSGRASLDRARAGATVGQIPVGYLAVRAASGRRVETDPHQGPLVSWAFEAFASGEHELPDLLAALTGRGLTTSAGPRTQPRPLTAAQLVRLLRNPYYLGVVSYRGMRYTGQHDPLVDRVTFERVQRRLDAEAGTARHYLDAAVTCGRCGNALRVRRPRRAPYPPVFVCARTSCDQQPVGVDVVELLVADHYRDLTLEPELRAGVAAELDGEEVDLHRAYQEATPSLRREFNQALFAQLHFTDDGKVRSTPSDPPVAVAVSYPNVDEGIVPAEPSPATARARPRRVTIRPLVTLPSDPASASTPFAPRLPLPGPLVIGSALVVTWGAMILLASILQPSAQTQRVALFFHLAALVLGFGAVLFVDWHGLLFLAGRRSHRDVVSVVCGAHPLIWSGLAVLVASGTFLRPNLTSSLTWVKLCLVLLLALNGLVAAQISVRLRALGDRSPTARLLVLGGIVAVVSQASWWGSTLIGFVNATS